MKNLKLISLLTALVMVLSGCTSIQPGPGVAVTTPNGSEPILPPQTQAPVSEPAATTPATENTEISDVIEPVVSLPNWDYEALSNEVDGWGQGLRFDDLNRPKSAVRFNESFSKYNATAIEITEEKIITLTFDQGYENGFTADILDTLKEKGVKATFFLLQSYAEKHPELVQRMIDEGHTLGNHSVSHPSIPELSYEDAVKEIMGLHEYILLNYGVCMDRFRPPKGEYSERTLAITANLGYQTFLWSFAYADWDNDNQPDPEESLQKLIERAHPGAIYLLHSVSETNSIILGDFIDAMLEQGYTFK